MNKKLIIWDWNGTLLNDTTECIESINIMLEKRNMPLVDFKTYREVFTFPVINYYKAVGFNLKKEKFKDLSVEYIDLYRENSKKSNLHKEAIRILNLFKISPVSFLRNYYNTHCLSQLHL